MENKDHNKLQRKRNIMNSLKETMKKIHDNPFPERHYIGVIKFYDSNKGFGFIASNNCGMNSPAYEQDFYVDSSSFLEESAKSDRRLVVFQWKAQSRGKRRAINVRNYSSKSEEDLELALSYYGDHEFVQLKEQKINMFNHLGVKRPQMLPLLKRKIETSSGCSPKEICNKILHLVKKYKTELPEDKRYIFTKDYDNENRNAWNEIFSLLKREEWIELLNTIPPVVLYVQEPSIITQWIDGLSVDISDTSKLKDLDYSKRFIPKDLLPVLKDKIEVAVNQHILSVIDENITKTLLPTIGYGITSKTRMEQSIHEYLPYTSKDFDEEISLCKRQVKINQFNKLVEEFDPSRYDSTSKLDKLIEVFKSIDNNDILQPIIIPLIEKKITSFLETKSFPELSKFLTNIRKEFNEIVNNVLTEISEAVIDYLTESVNKSVDTSSQYEFERCFEKKYASAHNLLRNTDIESFKKYCSNKILTSSSVDLLNYASTSDYSWIDKDTATQRVSSVISKWNFKEISTYIANSYGLDNIPRSIKKELASRALQIIGPDLDTPFDGTPIEEYNVWSSPKEDNISFLEKLKKLCITDELRSNWDNYIFSLSSTDIITLYYKGIISKLSPSVLSQVVNDLSIESASTVSERWYSVPSFKDQRKKKIFSDPNLDFFEAIASRLKVMEITRENIPLAIWLVELLAANKPDSTDYYEYREWVTEFSNRIKNLKASTSDNRRLGVLLWAIHLQTTSNRAAMTEIFPWLPPYLQIKIAKRLFQYIGEGKMSFTAHSLYDFLTTSEEKLCLALEIVFSYLKLREENPQATFTNAHMLSLIDGRDDHPEWIGIREFMVKCDGRWIATEKEVNERERWSTPFYNGLLTKPQLSSEIQLFVPNKMVDDRGNLQSYNNKYYRKIREIIELNFHKESYRTTIENNGIKFIFKEDDKIAVLSLARFYNIHNTLLYSTPEYVLKEDLDEEFCECRLANAVSRNEGLPFYWCSNKPCFRPWVRFHTSEEWENYTVLDFMRILNIPTDYVNKAGSSTRFGYFIILSSFLRSFARFYEHLICRKCGKLLHPLNLTNFASRSVTEFACQNEACENKGVTIYLNHCFNKTTCKTIIDSRDSKQCPNGQYICPKCGGCCSTGNFRQRLYNLHEVGGIVSPWLENFVSNNLGHWEKNERYCYRCGKLMTPSPEGYACADCNIEYIS